MRTMAFIAAASLAATAPAVAQSPPAGNGPSPDFLARYPPQAESAGISGTVVLRCALRRTINPKSCKIESEMPAGYGFGKAALELSKLLPARQEIGSRPPTNLPIRWEFQANPLAIHVSQEPFFVHVPTESERLAAQTDHLTPGMTALDCVITVQGTLDPCTVKSENPPNHGFAAAARKLASYVRLYPPLYDGVPQGGTHMPLPIRFNTR